MNRRSIFIAASLLTASLVLAQVREDVRILPAPASAPAVGGGAVAPAPGDGAIAGRESSQGVYVRDSAIAVEKFALAQRMERLKEWNKAADALQEVIERHADRVMPSQVDAKNVIYQYTSVTTAVQERLAKWPAEGLDVYRARFEPAAAALLENAAPEDVGALHRAYALYFVTETGKAAGLRLVDLYLESGEFPAAAWLAERLLAWHPTIDAERPKLTYRAALAQHLSGDSTSAAAKLDALKQNFADAKAPVRGQEVVLAESLAQELATAPPIARGAAGDSWPMLGGAPDRGRVPEAGGRLGALINFVEYARAARPRLPHPEARPEIDLAARQARDGGLTLGVLPAVDRGEMFFQDNARIYAVSLETGVALSGWAATYGDRGGRYVAPGATPLPRNQHFTVTVTDNAVLAVTGQIDTALLNQGLAMPTDRETTRLVCLDRATGKERWTVTPRQLPDAVSQLRTLAINGSPLVVGDNVYVLGRGGKPMQFEDSYVLCYSLRDGSYRWSCYLASGNADPNAMQGAMGLLGDNVTHLAYASGRLYALTNLGALAAIDAYSGTIVWLNIYPRPKPDFGDLRGRWIRTEAMAAPAKPWHHNPVIVKEGKVFILPDDAQHVLVYDAGSGVELRRIRTGDFEGAKTLLGVIGEKLILCGDRSVFCVNWQTYDPKGARDSSLIWPSTFARQNYKGDVIRGRGFITTDSVFIPTAWSLYRLSLKSGKVEQSYPRDREWDAGEGPGNVLVTQDHVILATADRVNVYTDLTVARARLDASVDAAPNDPEPRLRYAEMMFVSNQLDVGLEKLDEAMSLLSQGGGGATTTPSAMRPGPGRDRVFNIALTFAQKLANPEASKPEERELAQDLFDRAGVAADSPAQQVNYRMARARFAEPPEQVRLYQEVLADEQLRAVPYAADEGGSSQAAAVAEAEIGRIVNKAGKDVYAPYEARATEALQAAQAGNDADALLAVARVYPNAGVAPEAMMAAAEAYEAAGNARGATQVLSQAYHRYRTTIDPARVIEGQVRNHLKLPGGAGVAIGWLGAAPKGATLRKPLALPDGTTLENVTLAEVAATLHRYSATAATNALADFNLPAYVDPSKRKPGEGRLKPLLPEQPDSAIADVDMLVVPQRDRVRHDRVITWTANKGLAIYPVGQSDPVGSHAAFPDTPKGAAWVEDQVLVWGPTRAVLLAGQSGAVRWEMTLKGLGPVDVAAPGEVAVDTLPANVADAEAVMAERRMMNIRLRAARGGFVGNAVAVNPMGAPAVAPPAPGAGEQIEHVRPAGERAIVSTTTGRVVGLDLANGKAAWQTRLVEGPLMQLLANDDFTVARFADASGVQIVMLHTYSGQPAGPRRLFPLDGARHPINMALSPDGTLVWTLQGQLFGKNLYEPGKQLKFQVPDPPDGNPRYANASLPDQLLVANGRILVVSDNGQYVRVHSLENGKEISGAQPLATGSVNNPAVFLRPVGSRLYVLSPKNVASYNLDRVEDSWNAQRINIQPPPAVRDAMIGQDYIVLLDQLSGQNANAPGPRQGYRLLAFWRGQTQRPGGPTIESGLLYYDPVITSPAGVSSEWQGVNGGFYYRTLDRTVHFLRGARPPAAAG